MKVFHYLSSLYLFYVSSTFAEPQLFPGLFVEPNNPPLIPGCPIVEYGPSPPTCYDINGKPTCPPGQFCCPDECGGSYCAVPETIQTCSPYSGQPCVHWCQNMNGYICQDSDVCCKADCGYYCGQMVETKVCPALHNDCPSCHNICHDDTGMGLCSGTLSELMCCPGECGQFCVEPAFFREICPHYQGQTCYTNNNCKDDSGTYMCGPKEFCCEGEPGTLCDSFCALPDLEKHCPPPAEVYSNQCYPTCRDNIGKDMCPSGELCCPDQCGEDCVKPDYYKVLCPNESILEAPEPWERLTMFCIENCDCHDFGGICCDSPCGCELDICRNPVIQKAECPPTEICNNGNLIDCGVEDYCYQFGQVCCDSCGRKTCQNPIFVPGPSNLWEIGNPEVP